MGTPKTLSEAIGNGQLMMGKDDVASIESHVRDFIAQGFAASMLAHPECEDVLQRLFEQLVKKARA